MVRERSCQSCADALVDAANQAGGLDNITVVVVDVISIGLSSKNQAVLSRGHTDEHDSAGLVRDEQGLISQLNRLSDRLHNLLSRGAIAFLLALLLLLGASAGGVWLYAWRSACLIAENGQVVIYRGLVGDVFGFSLRWQYESTGITVDALGAPLPERLKNGIQLHNLQEAEELVEQYRRQINENNPDSDVTESIDPDSSQPGGGLP
jgi:protein phosphatase